MRAAQLSSIILVLIVSPAVAFLVPTHPISVHDKSASWLGRHELLTHFSANNDRHNYQKIQQLAASFDGKRHTTVASLAASGGDGGGVEEKKGGIEPKYLAALGVVILAALYDLFVTHEGRLWEL